MRRVKADGSPTEDAIQEAVIDYLWRVLKLEDASFHIANEGKRTHSYGHKLKQIGMKRGVFDIFITLPLRGYHGFWLELKSKGGTVSIDQLRFKKNQESYGYYCAISYSIEEALREIDWYVDGY